MTDWYALGRRILAEWRAAGQAAAEGARTAPLTRALDCVDAADALVARLNSGVRLVELDDSEDIPRLVAAYEAARGER